MCYRYLIVIVVLIKCIAADDIFPECFREDDHSNSLNYNTTCHREIFNLTYGDTKKVDRMKLVQSISKYIILNHLYDELCSIEDNRQIDTIPNSIYDMMCFKTTEGPNTGWFNTSTKTPIKPPSSSTTKDTDETMLECPDCSKFNNSSNSRDQVGAGPTTSTESNDTPIPAYKYYTPVTYLHQCQQQSILNNCSPIQSHCCNCCKNIATTYNGKMLPANCAEALYDNSPDGVYLLHLPGFSLEPFYVYCMMDPNKNGAAWTIVQRRLDGTTDFFRNWNEYKYGFGSLSGEFFLGLEKLHAFTYSRLHELWIQLEDFGQATRYARYDNFIIGDESSEYALINLGKYEGNAGDAFSYHSGHKFTTKDRDNDDSINFNCAILKFGAWWYNKCHHANLNGMYVKSVHVAADKYGQGVTWNNWHGENYSLKYVHMAIRPKAR